MAALGGGEEIAPTSASAMALAGFRWVMYVHEKRLEEDNHKAIPVIISV